MTIYPKYWQSNKDTYWLKTGSSQIEAHLVVHDSVVEFKFYDYGKKDCRRREFSSATRARNWACKFGRLMIRLEKTGKVPTPEAFANFKFSIF